jgi:hypothetical protein
MPHYGKIVGTALIVLLASLSEPAAARERLYPLTRCGPGLTQLCWLDGSFEGAPFHYNLAIHHGCFKSATVRTPTGVERRLLMVCGAPERDMIQW